MKISIRTKIFSIFLITVVLSFILMFLSFNIITSYHIKRESIDSLNKASATADRISQNFSPNFESYSAIYSEDIDWTYSENYADNQNFLYSESKENFDTEKPTKIPENTNTQPSGFTDGANMPKAEIDAASIALNLHYSLLDENNKTISFFLTDSKNGDLIYPPPEMYNYKEKQTAFFYDKNELDKLRLYFLDKNSSEPEHTKLDGTDYFTLKKPYSQDINIIFYKNNQQLKDLIRIINFVLLGLLFLTGTVMAAVVIRLTNGLVLSIDKLCSFSNDIGNGIFKPKMLNLKETELSGLETNMNHMAKKLSEYDAEQKTFFQNVSHELKTPLMSIQGYAEGISAKLFKSQKVIEAADIILEESDRLSDMVDNILCLSHLDSKDRFENKTDFECTEVIENLLRQLKPVCGEIKLNFHTDNKKFIITGNPEMFGKAVMSILTNAIRYADKSINISCSARIRTIKISDDGPGIAEKDMPYIFQRFYKGLGGQSGIGLAIAETAIKSMNGTLSAKNKNGAVFTIKFYETDNS